MEPIVTLSLTIAAFYLLAGLLSAFAFLWKGIHLLDEGAQGSSIKFKAIIFPGIVLFWPVLLIKWIKL